MKTKKKNDALEIIDGQQRITTLTLLFRAFFENLKTEGKKDEFQDDFGKFIWKKIRNVGFVFDEPYLNSQVITSKDEDVLKDILKENINIKELESSKSNYAKNFIFFHNAIKDFKGKNATDFAELCNTILSDTFFVLCVTCDSQDTAMTIFNTLNSRGMPLSNADIIKGEIYKNIKNKEEFAEKWQEISSKFEECNLKDDMSVLFNQAMFAIRAVNNANKKNMPGLLDFFRKKGEGNYGERDGYLKEQAKIDELMNFIEILVYFWSNPKIYLSKKAYRYYSVLDLFQNQAWKPYVAFLIWKNKDLFIKKYFSEKFNKEIEACLLDLLKEITANLLRNKATTDNIRELIFKMTKNSNNNEPLLDTFLDTFSSNDKNRKPDRKKVKYLLYLYANIYDDFSSDIDVEKLEVEHILPQKWQNIGFGDWDERTHGQYLEQIGNKILLSKDKNIKCGNDFFSSKQAEYKKENLKEVKELGSRENKIWSKADIEARNKAIEEALRDFVTK